MTATQILVLCRANRCRSPLFAEMLRAGFAASGHDVGVVSSGFLEPGLPVSPSSAEEAAVRGLDISGHLSRRTNADEIRRSSLVLTMGFEQLRDVVALEPEGWSRAHTVRGFIDRAAQAPRAAPGLEAALASWHVGRRAADLLRDGRGHDVPDPMGGPRQGYAAMGRTFDDLVPAVVALVRKVLTE